MKDNNKKSPAENAHSKLAMIMFVVLLILMSFIFGFMIFSYMLALATGAMLALLCYPLLKKLMKWGISSRIAAFLLTVGMILLAVIPITIFLFLAIQQGLAIAETFAGKEFSTDHIFDRMSDWGIMDRIFSSPKAAKTQLYKWLEDTGTVVAAGVLGIVSNIPNALLQLALMIISFFYFLVDGPRFVSWIYGRVPLDPDVRKKIGTTFSDTTVSVILATLATAVVQAAIMFVAFIVLSVPAAFLATAATFIFAWIPIVGSTPVWITAAIYLYSKGWLAKAILMLLFGVITGLADNFVRPIILKGRSNMHPLVSLAAIFGGIGIFGITGVFIGPIIAALLTSLLQISPVIQHRAESMPTLNSN